MKIGIPVEQMAKLDANENLHPVPKEMMVILSCMASDRSRFVDIVDAPRRPSLRHWHLSQVAAVLKYILILLRSETIFGFHCP